MSASNNRIKEYDTVHHLVSRIAHKVFFLGDDERNDLIEMTRRAAAHLDAVQRASMTMQEENVMAAGMRPYHDHALVEDKIIAVLLADPMAGADKIAGEAGLKKSSVYKYLKKLVASDRIVRMSAKSPWIVKVE